MKFRHDKTSSLEEHNRQLALEVQSLRDQLDGIDRTRQARIEHILGKFASMAANTYRGAPKIDESIEDFNFLLLREPKRHSNAYFRGVQFNDGLLLRATTENRFSDSLHTFMYKYHRGSKDVVPEYSRIAINDDAQVVARNYMNKDRIETIADVPGIEYDLGHIAMAMERQVERDWPSSTPTLRELDLIRRKTLQINED